MAPPANNSFTAKRVDSEAVVYQTKNTARYIQQRDQEKTSLKQMQSTMLNVAWVNITNLSDTRFVSNGIELFHKVLCRTARDIGV